MEAERHAPMVASIVEALFAAMQTGTLTSRVVGWFGPEPPAIFSGDDADLEAWKGDA
jgi:hypothetical protein